MFVPSLSWQMIGQFPWENGVLRIVRTAGQSPREQLTHDRQTRPSVPAGRATKKDDQKRRSCHCSGCHDVRALYIYIVK
jgi:hypothetical protein